MDITEGTYHVTFYGVHVNDWSVTFGSFSNHHKLLLDEHYLSDGCSCATSSEATHTHKFLFPHHIRKTYFIEGIAEGQITVAASSATATMYAYRVSICKVHEDTTETELFTTGWRVVNLTLNWDSTYNIGEELVLPFWIDCTEKAKLSENERIYVKIETDTSTCTQSSCSNMRLLHDNSAEWEDFKIDIPFRW